jgi:hypothetical protein
MNILRLSIAILTFAAANVQAGESAAPTSLNQVTVHDNARLVVDCRDERLPTQRAVGQVLDTNNGSRVYAERERLVHTAHRECLRGASSVAFVRDASEAIPALAMADVSK